MKTDDHRYFDLQQSYRETAREKWIAESKQKETKQIIIDEFTEQVKHSIKTPEDLLSYMEELINLYNR